MFNKDDNEEMEDGMDNMKHMGHMGAGCCSKEFKLAMLEKKEKILQAKVEFIGKMKEMVKKSISEEKKME